MKSFTLFFASLVALTGLPSATHVVAQDRVQQELQRVELLLEQLQSAGFLQNADRGETKATLSTENPFSALGDRSVLGATLPGATDRVTVTDSPSNASPQVVIGEDSIRINIDGREFSVPRPQTARQDSGAALDRAGAAIEGVLQASNLAGLTRARAYQELGFAVSEFGKGDYRKAKSRLDSVRGQIAGEGMVGQTYALILFQTGDYAQSAEWAYDSLRSVKPFDWDTIRGLYGNAEDYADRYQQLQDLVAREPARPELRFLLGYHHLMLGHTDHAARELESVKQSLGDDAVIRRLTRMAEQTSVEPPQPRSN